MSNIITKEDEDLLDEELVETNEPLPGVPPSDVKEPGEWIKKKRSRIKEINLDELQKVLLNVLAREVRYLLKANLKSKLKDDESKSLVNYLKLLKELKKSVSADELNKLSDSQLEKLAAEKQPE